MSVKPTGPEGLVEEERGGLVPHHYVDRAEADRLFLGRRHRDRVHGGARTQVKAREARVSGRQPEVHEPTLRVEGHRSDQIEGGIDAPQAAHVLRALVIKSERAVADALPYPQEAIGAERHAARIRHLPGALPLAAEAEGEATVPLEHPHLVRLIVRDDHAPAIIFHHVADGREQVGILSLDLADLEIDQPLEDRYVRCRRRAVRRARGDAQERDPDRDTGEKPPPPRGPRARRHEPNRSRGQDSTYSMPSSSSRVPRM